jgi:hypothetical protein
VVHIDSIESRFFGQGSGPVTGGDHFHREQHLCIVWIDFGTSRPPTSLASEHPSVPSLS